MDNLLTRQTENRIFEHNRRENGERKCRAKVAWDSLILPQNMGGLKLLDPELQIHALLAKLFIRGLMPETAPWRTLIKYRMSSLRPKEAETGHRISTSYCTPLGFRAHVRLFGGASGERGPEFDISLLFKNRGHQRL